MVNVDRSRGGLLSDVVLAANKRLGCDNLYAVMGTPIRIGFLVPSPDKQIGNDLDVIFQSEDPEECIEFVKKWSWLPEFPPDDSDGPRTDANGRLLIAEDWDGKEVGRGVLREIKGMFDYRCENDGKEIWFSVGESYNVDFTKSPIRLFGAWIA